MNPSDIRKYGCHNSLVSDIEHPSHFLNCVGVPHNVASNQVANKSMKKEPGYIESSSLGGELEYCRYTKLVYNFSQDCVSCNSVDETQCYPQPTENNTHHLSTIQYSSSHR
ncbi:unnamed protein product [Didymodactylos carnosus]|uniref:Uncharacterized protein n=1 Tax=Didymodactylos carnosus TaxID=1234261 RepID=A0A814J0D4_9BILA|nr:unnamed protein product [Didymodactylos carnosus]CAF1030232.1 unnamed protein product [Didymodactylos carnosus]CAF3714331.1 unnamed protein product [Didymodactylos carnosus]CAF3801144.1 unnamed protein product [Didymodactylos carnosus]